MRHFPTAQEAGLKFLDPDDENFRLWVVLATSSPRDDFVDRANFETLCHEASDIGEGWELVDTPLGQALLVPPEAFATIEAARELWPAMRDGRPINQGDYDHLVQSATATAWTQMGVARRLTLCLLAKADPSLALEAKPPPQGSGTLRTLAENEARTWNFGSAPETAPA